MAVSFVTVLMFLEVTEILSLVFRGNACGNISLTKNYDTKGLLFIFHFHLDMLLFGTYG